MAAVARGTKEYLSGRVRDLTAKTRELRAQVTALKQELVLAQRRERALREDLKRLAVALKREAEKRSWCSEYELFVKFWNQRLSEPHLVMRPSVQRAWEEAERLRAERDAIRAARMAVANPLPGDSLL